jgi:putative membrane protein
MHPAHRYNGPAIWKGVVAGLAGGIVAAWTMNEFQAALSKLTRGNGRSSPPQGDDATVKAASALSESIADHTLSEDEKRIGGPIIHYVFGTAMGALYGAVVEVAPAAKRAWGLPFGAALWLGADEIAVPATGLSGPPTDSPVSTHASALAAHLVYGATADAVRRLVRAALT